jgi:hypothetical protein
MLRVSDVWELALHAPDAAITEDGDVIIVAFPATHEPDDT